MAAPQPEAGLDSKNRRSWIVMSWIVGALIVLGTFNDASVTLVGGMLLVTFARTAQAFAASS